MKISDVKAFAKINFGLEVLQKRPDGFHNINTIFLRVGLFDTLSFEFDENAERIISVDCKPSIGILQGQNLVFKAAKILQTSIGTDFNVSISISKKIPAGAGLGGGSSDAACALKTLPKLWNISVDNQLIDLIGQQLGSDVGFFLNDSPAAIGRNRGELITPFSFALPYWILIVYPNIHVSTPWAYRALNITQTKPTTNYPKLLANNSLTSEFLRENIKNDFETVIFAEYPTIATIKEQLYEFGAIFALMSGSGSSIFGLFNDKNAAKFAAHAFSEHQTFVCDPII